MSTTLVIVVATLLVTGAAVAAAGVVRARRAAKQAHTASREQHVQPAFVPAPRVATVAVGIRLVAVDADPEFFVLDGVVAEASSLFGPPGWPISVRVHRPDTLVFDIATHDMLSRWVANDADVHVAITLGLQRRVSIANGGSVVRFELEGVSGLASAA